VNRRKADDTSTDTLADLAARRIAIEAVEPEIDCGRFASKAVAGREVTVSADIFGDGHESFGAEVDLVGPGGTSVETVAMRHLGNDRWSAEVQPREAGPHRIAIRAWRDLFGTWRHDTAKKVSAGQSVDVEIEEARLMIAPLKARGEDGKALIDPERQVAAVVRRIRPRPAALGRPRTRGVQRVVRAFPALAGAGPPARHLRRRDPPSALCP